MVYAQENIELLGGFQQSLFKALCGKGVVSCYRLLAVGSFVLAAVCIGQVKISVNLQENKCYSLFCNFLSTYEWALIGLCLGNSLLFIFQAIYNILLQKMQSPHD